jgi:hypothetical protein
MDVLTPISYAFNPDVRHHPSLLGRLVLDAAGLSLILRSLAYLPTHNNGVSHFPFGETTKVSHVLSWGHH